jgi:hypothetical protein
MLPVILLGAALLARQAGATVVRALDFDAQCAAAAGIFVGEVREVESRRVAERPSYFETLVTFAVEEVVAGAAGAEVTLRFAGGEVDGVRQSIDGMPELRVGERYVVFTEAEQAPKLVSPLVGFNQGLYRVVSEAGRDVVRDRHGRALPGAAAAPAGGGESAAGRAAPAESDLSTFVAAVQAARRR